MAERLTLKREKSATPIPVASNLPIARVLVDTGVGHLDEPYDYLVPAKAEESAQPGVRVRVRFAGRLVDGWIIERRSQSDFPGKLTPLNAVVSSEVLLSPDLLQLAVAVAEKFAGATWDVLRTAIPKRHAKTELSPSPPAQFQPASTLLPSGYPRLENFFEHRDAAPRAVWSLTPGESHFEALAQVVNYASQFGGVLVVVPDERDVAFLGQALHATEGVVALTASLSPSERYRRYLRLSRGVDRICIGTRSSAFAPVQKPALFMVWDDGDASHHEPRTPGWNSRDVLTLRSHLQHVPLLLAGFTVSVDSAQLLESGWAKEIPSARRAHVQASDSEAVRVSSQSWKVIKEKSSVGPVLVSVPRLGYLPTLLCRRCHSPALCTCGGRIGRAKRENASCSLCGAIHETYRCAACGGEGFSSATVGIERTVEEFGKAFPQRVIRQSTGERPVASLPQKPMIVVSTQGVEPFIEGGYSAVIILDGQASLLRSNLRAEEEARRRWFNTAALAAPDAPVIIAADGAHPSVQALIRWTPAESAKREVAERASLHLSPAWDVATIDTSSPDAHLAEELARIGELLGPIALGDEQRYVVRRQRDLAVPLRGLLRARGAKKSPPVRARLNPIDL